MTFKQSTIDMLSMLDDDLRMLDDDFGRPLLASLATHMARRVLKDDVTIGFEGGWWHRIGRYYIPDGQTFKYDGSSMLAWKDEVSRYVWDAQDYWFNGYWPKPGDWVVDIGAGRGEDVLAFAEAIGPDGRIFAIEAHPESFRRLKRFCEMNRLVNVVTIHAAAMDEAGVVHIEDDNSGAWIANSVRFSSSGPAVQALRFDDLRDAYDISRIDFLKMNIEGAERPALLGMARTLRILNDVCICAHDFRADRGEGEEYRTRDFVVDVLTKNGFTVTRRFSDPRAWVQDHVFGTRKSFETVADSAVRIKAPPEGTKNVALRRPACQSSTSAWSQSRDPNIDAGGVETTAVLPDVMVFTQTPKTTHGGRWI